MESNLLMPLQELKDFLEYKHDLYNNPSFIETDPISIPHAFNNREDIEISAFLTATIAWGQRKSILKNASKLMTQLGNSPYSFIMEAAEDELKKASEFVHRTFNHQDTYYFLKSIRSIYNNGGLQPIFEKSYQKYGDLKNCLDEFRTIFLSIDSCGRTSKHVSDVMAGSTGKRLNMFLRWLIRKDNRGVDFGLWKNIPASALYLPLDVHTGNVSRKLQLLKRNQNDWKAVEEITAHLRTFDPLDPVKYDFALFGLGVFEKF